MKAITNTGTNQLTWMDWPLPMPKPGQVRIRTGACGICATDLAMIAGWSRTGFPAIPGHEWAGLVDSVGLNVDETIIGQHCVGENVLSDGGEVGFEYPGGYGEYFITDARNIYRIPDQFPLSTATLIEPLAVCVRAVRKLTTDGMDRALMYKAGIKYICMVGGRDDHLKMATELGAIQTINYHDIEGDLSTVIHRSVGELFPIVVEASGSSAAIEAALELVQKCGQLLVLGDYGRARASFKWNHLLHQEIEIIGSNASADAWPEAVRLATSGYLPLERFITHCLPASSFTEGIELTRGRRGYVIKVVLDWTKYGQTQP
jgi:L-iditol 2-dehydrogenase